MTLSRLATAVALTLAAGAASAESFEQIKIDAGHELYKANCRRCHAADSTDPSYGPPLEDALYRIAGTYPDYAYSEAMAAAGFVWTPGAVRAWMEANDVFLPGTKMRHVGIEDRTVQDFILAYMASISTRTPPEPGEADAADAAEELLEELPQ